jgi:hypothetical protein
MRRMKVSFSCNSFTLFISFFPNFSVSDASYIATRNWLDLLWLAHNRQMSALKSEAIEQLPKLINIENVVSVLVCAHTIGEKKVCVSSFLQTVELFR